MTAKTASMIPAPALIDAAAKGAAAGIEWALGEVAEAIEAAFDRAALVGTTAPDAETLVALIKAMPWSPEATAVHPATELCAASHPLSVHGESLFRGIARTALELDE